MDAEVHHASAAREFLVEKPWFVWSVGVMKHQIDAVNFSEITFPYQLADTVHADGVAVGKVDAEKPVRLAACIHHRSDFILRAPQGLLAEYRKAGLEGSNGLFGMQGAWRSNDDAIEVFGKQPRKTINGFGLRRER